jgi:hypothetical protein
MKRFFIQNGALRTLDDVTTHIHTVIDSPPQLIAYFRSSSTIPCEMAGAIGLNHFVEVDFVFELDLVLFVDFNCGCLRR